MFARVSALKKEFVRVFLSKLRFIREIRQLHFFSLQMSIRSKKCETKLVDNMCVPYFSSAMYVRETQPDRATVVAHSLGRLPVFLFCATNMDPRNANLFG